MSDDFERKGTEEELIDATNGRGVAWTDRKTVHLPDDVTFGKHDWTLTELASLTGINPYHLHVAYLGMAELSQEHKNILYEYLSKKEQEQFEPFKSNQRPWRKYSKTSVPKNRYDLIPRAHVDNIDAGDLLYYIDNSGEEYWIEIKEKEDGPVYYILHLDNGLKALVGRQSYMRVQKKKEL